MAIRISLGASRRRIAIQLLIESLLLTAAGAIAGLWLGRIAAGVMWALRPEGVAGVDDIVLDGRVLAFALAAAVAGLAFGLAPLARLPELDPMHALRRGSARGGPGAHRARRIVTAGEIALGVVLLAGATLMARVAAKGGPPRSQRHRPQRILTRKMLGNSQHRPRYASRR